jgi:hypothetical protein
MSLQARLTALAQAFGADVKAIIAAQGNLASLTTANKTSLVAAINSLQLALDGAGANVILDSAAAGDTAHTWSADKIVASLAQLKTDIIDGAPAAYDTLIEIANKLAGDDTALAGLLTAVGNRVSFDAPQSLTAPQQQQARDNIGAASAADIGDPDHDFVADYDAAKAA